MNEEVNWVEHPPHYVSESGVECIDIVRHLPNALATAVKYVWRFRDKWDPSEDLKKAKFYLNDYETHLFKGKRFDASFHAQTVLGAKAVMETGLRDQLRTHIVWLTEKGREEASFFEALYAYLRTAQHGRVSHDKFAEITKALLVLQQANPSATNPARDNLTETPLPAVEEEDILILDLMEED